MRILFDYKYDKYLVISGCFSKQKQWKNQAIVYVH